MTTKKQISLQIGTAFDLGQQLIWSLAGEPDQSEQNFVIRRPRSYRGELKRLAELHKGSPAPQEELEKILDIKASDASRDARYVLNITDVMQPPQNFCPAGDWFFGLGERASWYCGLFADTDIQLLISLRNPAMLLSDSWSSGSYPGFDTVAPDPFQLRWASVLRDLRAHCPDVPITAWCAEESPMIWERVLDAAAHPATKLSVASEIHIANKLMNSEGRLRLEQYLTQHPEMPKDLRARAIAIFLDKFATDDAMESEVGIPGWTDEKHEKMEEQYAADIAEVATLDGVTLISI